MSLRAYIDKGLTGVSRRLEESVYNPTPEAVKYLEDLSIDNISTESRKWFARLIELSRDTQMNGKRFRARLALVSSWSFGLPIETATSLGAFVEMIQTASLIHDDVVDDADTRRGDNSVRNIMGNRFAVLTGDYILSLALSELSKIAQSSLFSVFASVVSQMTLGEAMELEYTGNPNRSLSHYFSTISLKTASLISFATYTPSLITDANPQICEKLKSFGTQLGLTFQLVDDILDFVAPDGKKSFKDFDQGLATLPLLTLGNLDVFTQTHDQILLMLKNDSSLEESVAIARQHQDQSTQILEGMSDAIPKDAINQFKIICTEIFDRLPDNLRNHKGATPNEQN